MGKYEKKLQAEILNDSRFYAKEIFDFTYVTCLPYFYKDYLKILNIIKTKEFSILKELYKNEARTFEDLSIVRFSDEMKRSYTAIFYDSDELWQDPELLEIISD